jgi:hypothetical protein
MPNLLTKLFGKRTPLDQKEAQRLNLLDSHICPNGDFQPETARKYLEYAKILEKEGKDIGDYHKGVKERHKKALKNYQREHSGQ